MKDIKESIKNFHTFKDQTVNALKEEGKVLQHEQDMKAKIVLHHIKHDVEEEKKSNTHHDF